MNISVIISTYNNAGALEKALWGYGHQTTQDFEIIVADDGSTSETRDLVLATAESMPNEIGHIWHEDRGFRKNRILNRATSAALGDYLIFSDGDCIPRDDFVESHRRHARHNCFLTGGSHIDVPASVHDLIDEDRIASQQLFDTDWLAAQGISTAKYHLRLTRSTPVARTMDFCTPRPGAFVGANSSAWKKDIVAINGFNEEMPYGGEDKELGIRLSNSGVKSRRLKYSLVCVHLSHPRGYVQDDLVLQNKRRLKDTRRRKITWIDQGMSQRTA